MRLLFVRWVVKDSTTHTDGNGSYFVAFREGCRKEADALVQRVHGHIENIKIESAEYTEPDVRQMEPKIDPSLAKWKRDLRQAPAVLALATI